MEAAELRTSRIPSTSAVAWALLWYLAGAMSPAYYAQERMRGFGRAIVDRLPYVPPPGMSEDEALRAALESAEEAQADSEEPAMTAGQAELSGPARGRHTLADEQPDDHHAARETFRDE